MVTDERKQAVKLKRFLEAQRARGGTGLAAGDFRRRIAIRIRDRTLNVVVLSDGMTEQQEQRELLQLIRRATFWQP